MTGEAFVAAESSLRRPLIAAVVLIHVLFVAAPLDVLAPVDPSAVADLVLSGQIPYRDFQFEYPPLAVIAFLPSGLVPASLGVNALALQAIVLELALVGIVLRHRPSALWRYGVLSILVFPFLSGGFDAIVMVSLAVSTDLLARNDARGWWVGALGAMAKLAPSTNWVWGRARMRTGYIAGVVTAVVCLSPILFVGFGAESWIGNSRERGVQAESVAASLTYLWRQTTGSAVEFEYRLRSWDLIGAETSGYVLLFVGAVLLAVIARHATAHVDPWLLAYASILAFMVGNKVLSPQFMAWPAPLAAILGGRWFWAHVGLCAATSTVYFFDGDLEALSPLIAARNAGLVGVTLAAIATIVVQARRREGTVTGHR